MPFIQGYDGEESMYVSQAILNDAFTDSGLALDFYKSYLAKVSVDIAYVINMFHTLLDVCKHYMDMELFVSQVFC